MAKGIRQNGERSANAMGLHIGFEISQTEVTRSDVHAFAGRSSDDGVDVGFLDAGIIDGVGQRSNIKAKSTGGVALRIEIDQKHLFAIGGQSTRKVNGSRGLSDSTFLIGNAYDSRHKTMIFQ